MFVRTDIYDADLLELDNLLEILISTESKRKQDHVSHCQPIYLQYISVKHHVQVLRHVPLPPAIHLGFTSSP